MLFRKIAAVIEDHLRTEPDRILLVDGARQVGKTYIIRYVAKKLFPHFVEINLQEDSDGTQLFKNVNTVEMFYRAVTSFAGGNMSEKSDTIIFLDEIQRYPHLLPLLKFLQQDGRYTYIASGSLLGVTLSRSTSIPMGSIRKIRMYPMDLEEFLIANGVGDYAINSMRESFLSLTPLDEGLHKRVMDLFKTYILVGGLPKAVSIYVETKNIQKIREYHTETQEYYAADASQYDREKRLKISRIYEMIPSNLENKKKRIIISEIEPEKKWENTYSRYADEFDYLISSGIALEVKAVSNPVFPLHQTMSKNLLKLYLNDVGLLSNVFFRSGIQEIYDDQNSINLGSVYESAVACELAAQGFELFYYDNRAKGEVDFLVNDNQHSSVLPLEIKSGKDYTVHSSLTSFTTNPDYNINRGFVLYNERLIKQKGKITYIPIYYLMFLRDTV